MAPASASAFFAYGEVSGPIDDGRRGRSEYPHSIRSNNLLYGSPVITTRNTRGEAMRRVRVGGIITAIRLKGAWNGARHFKFSLWQPRPDIRENGREFPGISCRNRESPRGIVTTASPDCVMQADMRKQAELPFVQPRPYANPDANRSQYNINGFGYSRVLEIQGRGAGRPTIFSIVDVRASVREQDWISVAPVEPTFAQLQVWRSNAVPQPSPTWEAAEGSLKMASQGGLCMHGAGRTSLAGTPGEPGGEGRPGRGGVWPDGRIPPPIETGELNVGMGGGSASEVRFSPCGPTFQYQGYNSPGGYTGLYYGNCHPENNLRYEGRGLWCHDPEIESNAMQVEYTIEPDADRDGWGDQTQGGKALAERNWLAGEAERRAREAADQAARDRWADIARRLRTTPVGVDVGGLLREAADLDLADLDFGLGGIAPGALPGQSPDQANPDLPETNEGNAADSGSGSDNPSGQPAIPGPSFTARVKKKKSFGAGTISVKVACPAEACNFVGQGEMTSKRRGKTSRPYALDRGPGRYLKAGRSGHVRVKMGQSQRRALRRAYKRGASLKATVTVYASNAAGGISEKRLTVRIPRAR
ncbi:MAG: hypothetical protein ACKOTH_02240 [Solirubrobacterales bacterium]